ncbi:hypothetical protein GALMADRAFT_208276 [Galerina marginata CBS 339.88]|uniref:NADP-dependent oxidoreductase domain-containing protein n=1 Tax=Galerina marginata (strain CBS 339.88) TaxID=685588 RepID=A0A067TM86_GALM3|nr:hypothetical protein GALMADRAFT_208276 [Galerina marginata CBS 339.88]
MPWSICQIVGGRDAPPLKPIVVSLWHIEWKTGCRWNSWKRKRRGLALLETSFLLASAGGGCLRQAIFKPEMRVPTSSLLCQPSPFGGAQSMHWQCLWAICQKDQAFRNQTTTTKILLPQTIWPLFAFTFDLSSLDYKDFKTEDFLSIEVFNPLQQFRSGVSEEPRKHPETETVKVIGVSKFPVKFFKACSTTPKSCQQSTKYNVILLVAFCREKGIAVRAYSPLGPNDSLLLKHSIVNKIADAHKANKPGVSVLSKSPVFLGIDIVTANARVIDLTSTEIKELQDIDKTEHFRACHPNWTGWGSIGFPDCE